MGLFCFGVISLTVISREGRGGEWLARELFAEGDWTFARREAARVSVTETSNAAIRILGDAAALHEGGEPAKTARQRLDHDLSDPVLDPELRAFAAFARGSDRLRRGMTSAAWEDLKLAFLTTDDPQIWLEAAALLDQIRSVAPNRTVPPELALPLATALSVRRARFGSDGGTPTSRSTWVAPVFHGVVWFYRRQIAPAIGRRCSLHPSCSEYFRQAAQRHDILALPMLGDRLVREPGLVAEQHQPVAVGREIRYADPVSDHISWPQ